MEPLSIAVDDLGSGLWAGRVKQVGPDRWCRANVLGAVPAAAAGGQGETIEGGHQQANGELSSCARCSTRRRHRPPPPPPAPCRRLSRGCRYAMRCLASAAPSYQWRSFLSGATSGCH